MFFLNILRYQQVSFSRLEQLKLMQLFLFMELFFLFEIKKNIFIDFQIDDGRIFYFKKCVYEIDYIESYMYEYLFI